MERIAAAAVSPIETVRNRPEAVPKPGESRWNSVRNCSRQRCWRPATMVAVPATAAPLSAPLGLTNNVASPVETVQWRRGWLPRRLLPRRLSARLGSGPRHRRRPRGGRDHRRRAGGALCVRAGLCLWTGLCLWIRLCPRLCRGRARRSGWRRGGLLPAALPLLQPGDRHLSGLRRHGSSLPVRRRRQRARRAVPQGAALSLCDAAKSGLSAVINRALTTPLQGLPANPKLWPREPGSRP